jgi:hypothetical protein
VLPTKNFLHVSEQYQEKITKLIPQSFNSSWNIGIYSGMSILLPIKHNQYHFGLFDRANLLITTRTPYSPEVLTKKINRILITTNLRKPETLLDIKTDLPHVLIATRKGEIISYKENNTNVNTYVIPIKQFMMGSLIRPIKGKLSILVTFSPEIELLDPDKNFQIPIIQLTTDVTLTYIKTTHNVYSIITESNLSGIGIVVGNIKSHDIRTSFEYYDALTYVELANLPTTIIRTSQCQTLYVINNSTLSGFCYVTTNSYVN